ncbi:major facilitator superfamily protein [Lentilactobacillus rapi DSM 19907 = JCM 15042]|uniref:MFS transporter n=3 Tax=Lentilactobacillus TaxID=2767893 RepID=A0A512PME4_9LACO|nr:MFS transporter [Lentilactobacillus rapi]KRL14874.1 major facilitator superfamily protein [Lentilactobacillus rapi DSM 19907 = JCM 15042]GEP72361.1 MFS transporter [Lentilactobacillus rapi]
MENQKKRWVYTPHKISIWRSIGYGINDMNGASWGTLVGSYLMFFLTTYGKLSAAAVGMLFLIGKFLNAIMSMLAGSISDRLYSTKIGRRFGRRHLLLLVGAILTILFFPMLFMVVPGSFWWYLIAFVMVETANVIIGTAYETLATEMTPNADDRVKMSSIRLFISAFATFSVSALPATLLAFLGEGAQAYTISGIVFGVVYAICTLITYRSTWEHSPEEVENFESANGSNSGEKENSFIGSLRDYWEMLRNKSARYMVSIYFMTYFAKDCFSTAFLYYVVFVLGLSQTIGQGITSLSFVGMIVVPIAAFILIKTKNPKINWSTSFSLIFIVMAGFFVLSLQHSHLGSGTTIISLIVLGVLWQIGRQFLEYTAWQVIPLVPDVDTIVSGKLRTGTFAAVQSFTRQLTGALGSALLGFILQWGGFQEGSLHQTLQAQNAILIVLIVVPIISIGIAWWMVARFNLNQRTHKILHNEIERLQSGGNKDDVDPQTKSIVEDLTGYKWDKIWNTTK